MHYDADVAEDPGRGAVGARRRAARRACSRAAVPCACASRSAAGRCRTPSRPTSSARSPAASGRRRSSCSARTSTRGTSAPARSTTRRAAASSSRPRGRSASWRRSRGAPIRVVLFANEENGLKGGKAYAEAHAAELASHVAALEADLGQGPPLGFSWNAGPSADTLLKAAAGLLAPIAADILTTADIGGADLIYLLPSGIPNLGLLLDATHYFDYHHTANDNFDRIDPKIMDRSTAATATLAYVLAESDAKLERIPPEKRALPAWARGR